MNELSESPKVESKKAGRPKGSRNKSLTEQLEDNKQNKAEVERELRKPKYERNEIGIRRSKCGLYFEMYMQSGGSVPSRLSGKYTEYPLAEKDVNKFLNGD